MNTQAISSANTPVRTTPSASAEDIKEKRAKNFADTTPEQTDTTSANAVQPEELLNNIKALTEDGLYSVRFEMHKDTKDLIINLVDYKSGELIRQIPPEEIVSLHQYMEDLRGNIVSIES